MLPRPLAGALPRPAGPPLDPDPDPASPCVLETPLPARLPEPVPRGQRLAVVAAVLPHPAGPARPPPHDLEQAGATRRPRHHRGPERGAAWQARRRQAAALPQAAGRYHRGLSERGLPDRCGAAGAGGVQAGDHQQAGAGGRGCAPDQGPGSATGGAAPRPRGRQGDAVAHRGRQAAGVRGDQAGRRRGRGPACRRRPDRGRRPSGAGAAPQRDQARTHWSLHGAGGSPPDHHPADPPAAGPGPGSPGRRHARRVQPAGQSARSRRPPDP